MRPRVKHDRTRPSESTVLPFAQSDGWRKMPSPEVSSHFMMRLFGKSLTMT